MGWNIVMIKLKRALELIVGAFPVVIKEVEKIRQGVVHLS